MLRQLFSVNQNLIDSESINKESTMSTQLSRVNPKVIDSESIEFISLCFASDNCVISASICDTSMRNQRRLKRSTSQMHSAVVKSKSKKRRPNVIQQNLDSQLRWASQTGNVDSVQSLIKLGASPYSTNTAKQSALFIASAYGHEEIAKILCRGRLGLQHISGPSGASPQHIAADNGHLACLRTLVEMEGAPKHEQTTIDGRTSLYMACQSNHIHCAQYLVDRAKSQKAYARVALMPDKHGVTPLHIASHLGHEDIIDILLHVDHNNISGETNSKLLTMRDCAGFTPLHTASCLGHANICQMLLSRGADPKMLNDAGHNAADVAKNAGHYLSGLIVSGQTWYGMGVRQQSSSPMGFLE